MPDTNRLRRRSTNQQRARPRASQPHARRRLFFEALEDRRLLAGFTWEMTPRVVADAKGRIAVPNNSTYAAPPDFEVVFDGSPTSPNAATYSWSITTTTSNQNYGGSASQPKFSTRVPEGEYQVSLTANGSTSTQQIFVNDILVVTMGDSMSAGEGNPETTLDDTNPVEWMQVGDTALYPPEPDGGMTINTPVPNFNPADVEEEQARYHAISSRSSYAAGAQMALMLEQADPHTSVTFVFVAASGSAIGSVAKDPFDSSKKTIGGGALLPFFGQDVADGYDGEDAMPPQIDQVKNIIGSRPVEVLTFSFGINDVGFTRIAKALLLLRTGNFEHDIESKLDAALNTGTHQAWTDLRQEVNVDSDSFIENQPVGGGLDGLPAGYALLEAELNTLHGTASFGPDNVYILEYMDLFSEFTNTTVTTCDKIMEDLLPLGAKLDATEIAWAQSRIFDKTDPNRTTLNEAVANGAAANGWTVIDDIATSFDGHGYCAPDDDRWVRRADEAAQLQGPNQPMTTGTLHPNRRGQAMIGELLTQQVLTDLFPTILANNPTADLQALITSSNNYFQKIIDSPLEGASGAHTLQDVLKDGLSGLFDLPLLREKVEFVDLDALFKTILSDLGAPLHVESTNAPALTVPSGGGDASFMVTVDGLGPINVRLAPQSFSTAADLETELNAQIADAGFGDHLRAEIVAGTGLLRLKTPGAESLSVATLQLRADAPAPANGRLLGPAFATQLTVDRQTGVSASTYQSTTTTVSFTIGAAGIVYDTDKTIATEPNVDASDLADAINQMLKAQGVYDVVTLVDRGANGLLDKNPHGYLLSDPDYPIAAADRDRLVFAATAKSVTGIGISSAQLGFNASTSATQPLDQPSVNNNQNPAWTNLHFRGQSAVPGRAAISGQPQNEPPIPDSLTQFLDLYAATASPSTAMKNELLSRLGTRLTASLQKLSLEATTDPYWPAGLPTAPANFTVVPSFRDSPINRDLVFQVQVDHLFQKPFELDLSNNGIPVGSLGTIEVSGTIDTVLIAPTHLNLQVGMYLGDLVASPLNAFNSQGVNYVGAPFTQNTPLRFLNAGDGVPLLVGMTAPNAAPAGGLLAGDAAFVLAISQNTSTVPSLHPFNLRQFSTGATSDPISSDNATPQNLADDLNSLFRKQGVHDLVRAAVLIEQGGNGLTERLYIHGIDSSVIGLTIAGSGGEALGFATFQDSAANLSGMSNWADLKVTVGSSSYFVDLDHARTLQDVKFAIQIQTLGAVTVSIDDQNQRLQISPTFGTADVYVSGGQGIAGVSERFAAASALGILREEVPGQTPAAHEIVGQPLHGLESDDRSYVDTAVRLDPQTGLDVHEIALGVGIVVDNTDVSAALGSISFDLIGNATSAADALLAVFGTLDIHDVKDSGDHRLYLTEEFNSATEILSLNVLSGGLPCGISGSADFEIGFSLVGDLTDSFLHSTVSVSDKVPITLDFSPTTNCGIRFKPANTGNSSILQSILEQAKNLDIADLLEALKGVGNHFKSNPPEAFQLNIPLLDKSVGDVVNFADALINAADNFLSSIDVDAVKQAVDAVGVAVSNLNVPQALQESRLRMLAAVDAIQRVLADKDEMDLDGNLRLEARLLASVRQLYRTVVKETHDTNGVLLPALHLQLVDALNTAIRTLIDQIPSLDTAKSQLEKAVGKSIADTFGVPADAVTFTFDYVKDIDASTANTDESAIVFGLTYDEPNLVAVGGEDDWTLTVGGKQVTLGDASANFDFRAGVKLDIGAGLTLSAPRKLFLIANNTTPSPNNLTNTKIVVDAGLNAQVTGGLGYKSFDLVDATVTAAFRAPQMDEWSDSSLAGMPLGVLLPLTGVPEGGLDPRLLIVTSFSSPGHVLDSAGATPEFTVTESPPGTFNLTILAWPADQVLTWPLGKTGPSRVTAEYLTAATQDVSVRANRASLDFTFDPANCTNAPNFPSLSNTIGAIGLADLSCAANLAANGLLTADVDATVLDSSVDNMITLAVSARHPLQPQFDFDETLIDDLFQGVDFNLCLIVPSIENFLLKLEEDVSHGALAKLPIAGKNIAQQTKVIKTLREEFAGPFLNYLCNDPSSSGALDAAAATIQTWLNQKLQVAFGLPLNSTDVSVVVTITADTFEIHLNVDKTETFTADFDSGLDGLPIKADGQGGVDVSLGFEIHVGFGLSKQDGFYVKPNGFGPSNVSNLKGLDTTGAIVSIPPGAELKIAASAKLQVGDASTAHPIPTSLTVDLFGLDLSATDILTTTTSTATAGTFIQGDVSFDLAPNSAAAADGRLTISELTSTPFLSLIDPATPLVELAAQVRLALEAGLNSTLPSVQADLMLDWVFKLNVENGKIVAHNQGFEFGFEDIGINLGDFLTRHIRPVLDQINKYIEPLQPVIDLLKTEIPGVTELSQAQGNGPVTFLDLALIRNPSQAKTAKKFINALDTIIRLARELKSGERDELVFILQEKLQLISSSGSNPTSTNLGDQDAADEVPLEDAEPDLGDSSKKSQGFVKRVLQSLEDLGVHLHILDVSNIISMLLHRPFDIVTYDIPRLDLPFSWEISFGIWSPPPIVARIGLDFNAFADLSIGYDSHGIDTGKFFDGFYFGDLQNGITGPDIDDFGMTLGVRLAALLQLAVASAGIEGEVRGDVLANWRDVDADGKMHLDEMTNIVKQDGFSCLFDLRLDVHAIVRLVYSAVGFSGSYDFIDKIIFSLQQQCPKYELGHVVEGSQPRATMATGLNAPNVPGTLVLHAGAFASQRQSGKSSDVDEPFEVEQIAPGVFDVRALGLINRYSGVEEIYFDGGDGEDGLTLINVMVPVTALGGAGNDQLVGTAFIDHLDGGPGQDVIRGRGAGDKLYGGPGDDLIYGDFAPGDDMTGWGTAGDDRLDGGAGQDLVYGGAGGDTIDGGPQRDLLFGGGGDDDLSGGSGPDLLVGGSGADLLAGLDGNDVLLGELVSDGARTLAANVRFVNLFNAVTMGLPHPALFQTGLFATLLADDARSPGDPSQDVLKGGVGNDLLIGDVGADALYGGWGNDTIIGHLIGAPSDVSGEYIEGNPGDDFICGADGVDTIFGGTTDDNTTGAIASGLTDVLADAGQAESAGGFTPTSCTQTSDILVTPAPTFAVRGVIYEDVDQGGTLDDADKRRGGWTVELLDSQDNLVDAVVSDATSGQYEFLDVTPGQYTVREVRPVGWLPVSPIAGTRSVPVDGGGGGPFVGDVDFGNRPEQGQLLVRQFHDLDGDGVRDPNEPFLNQWPIEIVGPNGSVLKRTEDLDRNGDGSIDPATEGTRAVFEGLPAGEHLVRATPRGGWVQSSPSLDDADTNIDARLAIPDDEVSELRSALTVAGISAAQGGDDLLVGIEVQLSIGHANVSDLEAYLIAPDGRLVKLFTGVGGSGDHFSGTVFKTYAQSTKELRQADGTEPFSAPFNGSDGYRAEEDLGLLLGMDPRGQWTLVIEDTLAGDAGTLLDWSLNLVERTGNVQTAAIYRAKQASVYQPSIWNEYHVTLGSDGAAAVEFGVYELATIHGFKFADVNGDGIRQTSEQGLGGITLFVDINDNGVRDRGESRGTTLFDDPQTTFNEAGYFSIGSVKPGTLLKVREEFSTRFRQTVPMDEGIGAVTPIAVTLLSGGTIGHSVREIMEATADVPLAPGLIFANQPLGEIVGVKWEDQDGDGRRDPSEPGMAGVTVYADLNHNGQFDAGEPSAVTRADDPATLSINESGRYLLPNLPAAAYEVHEVVPAGYVQTSGGVDVLYDNAFEGSTVGPEWTLGAVRHSPYGSRGYLGNFGNSTTTLKVNGVPENTEVTVSFDLFVLGSWTGNAEDTSKLQDRFRFRLGDAIRLDVSLSNLAGFPQSFPDVLGVGNHPARLGAIEVNTLGYESTADRVVDSVYHFEFTHVHGTGDLLLDFAAFGLLNITDVLSAQWGLDNVLVTTPAEFHEIHVGPGETVEQVDFSNRRSGGEIHGVKFNDLNGNGVRDKGELGIAGVRIYLDSNGNGTWEPQETSTYTMNDDPTTQDIDETGMYWLVGLSPGQYDVREVVPPTWQQTSTGTTVFYQNQFEEELAGNEWSQERIAVTPIGERHFLGLFANDTVTLTLEHLPPHQSVLVSADLYVVGSWDGNHETQGPDRWRMREDTVRLIDTTFSNVRDDGKRPPTWQNPKEPIDANNDDTVAPMDALVIMNDLNRSGSRRLGIPEATSFFLDVNNDGFIAPNDVLMVVNRLNLPVAPPGATTGLTGRVPQAYPDDWRIGEHSAQSGASETNTLGYGAYDLPLSDPRQTSMNAVYAVRSTFAHSANLLTLDFEAAGLVNREELAYEKWGLDNVVITLLGATYQVDIHDGQVVTGIDFGNQRSLAESEGPPAAPLNSVPGGQAISEDSRLVFSTGGGNAYSISDPDAGDDLMTVQLAATHGSVTVSATGGTTFDVGDGANDITMTFRGTLTAVNATLSTLTFSPDPDFHGTATLSIVSKDQGSAMGPMLTDTDAVEIDVTPVNDPPKATEDSATVRPTVPQILDVLANDFDPDEDDLTIVSFTQPRSGVVTLNPDGTFTYDPLGTLACSVEFVYTIVDAADATDSATVFITLSEPVLAEACVTFSGQKFHDENRNGNRDAGELGLDGWDIQLLRGGGVPLATTTTSVDLNHDGSIDPETERGVYLFQARITSGQYELKEVQQSGWVAVDPPAGTYSLTLAPTATPVVRNFANHRQTGSIAGMKWNDLDGDGIHDPGEPGIAGVTIYIDGNSNGVFDPPEEVGAVTVADDPNTPGDETGHYSILRAPTGRFLVREIVPAGFLQTFPNPVASTAHQVSVIANQSVLNVDFGNAELTSLLDGDDVIYGLGGADRLYGDNLILNPRMTSVGTLADHIFGGDGDDELLGQERDDVLAGEGGHDILIGGAGVDRVEQTVDQNQTLTDVLLTGQGDDSLLDMERATLTGGASANAIDASGFTQGPVVLVGLEGDDHLTGTTFDDRYVFLDAASAAEIDVLEDGGGTDLLDFSALTLKVVVDLTQANQMGLHGTRTITTSDSSQFENVLGGAAGDDITGNATNNEIHAGEGNDIVRGGDGQDTINGGAGDDLLEGGLGDDTFVVTPTWGSDSLGDSGGTADTLKLSDIAVDLLFTIDASGLHVVPAAEINLPVNQVTHAGNSIENVIGGGGDDRVIFADLATLAGGQGAIHGGPGTNSLDYRSYNTGVAIDLLNHHAQGTAAVFDFSDVFGSGFDDSLAGDANNNWLVGGVGNDTLFGADGDDRLVGGENDDNLAGGAGDDAYEFREVTPGLPEQDTIVELAGGGSDHVDFSSLSNLQFVEVDLAQTSTLVFGRQFQVGGPPVLLRTLNLPSNQLGLMPDIEIVSTGGGADTIVAHRFQSTLSGGAGADRYQLPNGLIGDVVLVEDASMSTGGVDTIDFSAFTIDVTFDLRLPTNHLGGPAIRLVDGLGADAPRNFENLTGGAGDDHLFGNRLANVLQGGAGDNRLYGGAGDDSYVVVDAAAPMNSYLFEARGTVGGGLVTRGGSDTLDFTAVTAPSGLSFDLREVVNGLANNHVFLLCDDSPLACSDTDPVANCIHAPGLFENIWGAWNARNDLTGNENDNILVGGNLDDEFFGRQGADLLIGSGGEDRLRGEEDRDVIVGGLGGDDLAGGGGDDILVGGFTSYDAVPAHRDLLTVRAAWLSTTDSYMLRIHRIMNGLGLGTTPPSSRSRLQSQPYQTVFDDSAVDDLLGDADLDWFLTGIGDDIGPLDAGE